MRLNLASGRKPVEGFTDLDGCIFPLDFKNIDVIRASHILEHFGWSESVDVLANWISCLKIGGILKIAVPDFDELIRMRKFGYKLPYEDIIMGGQIDERDYHKSIWCYDKLFRLMTDLGLSEIKTWQSEIKDCASYDFSLNLQGVRHA